MGISTTVGAISSAGKFLPSPAVGASSTSEIQIQDSAGNPYVVYLPGSNKVSNLPFRIKAWGRTTEASTPNLTVKFYYGTSSTIGSNTAIASSGALATTVASGNFAFWIDVIWDSVSTKFNGVMNGWVNGTAMALTTLTAVTKPAVAPTTEGAGLTMTIQFSGSNAANTVIVDGFELEVL